MQLGVPYGDYRTMDLGDTTNNQPAWSNPLLTRELHHSHIETLVGKCAKRFEWEYLIKTPTPSRPLSSDLQMNVGSACHEVISTVLSGTTKQLPAIMDDIYDKWVIPCIDDPKIEAKVSDEYQRNCFAALEYVTTRFDRRQVNSEKQFMIPGVSKLSPILSGISEEWRFAGSMDLVQFGETEATIADLKFRSRSNYQANKGSSQAPMYAFAALYYGYLPSFTYIEVVKGKVIEQKIELTEGRYDWLFIKARQAIDFIESGNFPISPNGWWCSSRYCRYWSVCRGRFEPDDTEVENEVS